jgi:predicted O-linked N-acetylglucosamine transferase (SPINDLY family)
MTSPTLTPDITEQIAQYEIAINQEGSIASNYWWLGISYLLSGDEIEAQATWFMPIANAAESEIENLTADLVNTLAIAAQQQVDIGDNIAALLIRLHLQEIDSNQLDNVLELIILSAKCEQLIPNCVQEWELAAVLTNAASENINQDLLSAAFSQLILVIDQDNADAIMDCLHYSNTTELLVKEAITLARQLFEQKKYEKSILIMEGCLFAHPQDSDELYNLSQAYNSHGNYQKSIDFGRLSFQTAANGSLLQKIKTGYSLIAVLVKASHTKEFYSFIEEYRPLIYQLISEPPADESTDNKTKHYQAYTEIAAAATLFFFPYIEDLPAQTHHYFNLAGKITRDSFHYLQSAEKSNSLEKFNQYTPELLSDSIEKKSGIIRIGYIASTLSTHSVGWLSRWLWQYRDQEKFQVFTYCLEPAESDAFNNRWFRDQSDITYYMPCNVEKIVTQIQHDKLDILVDLDSLTIPTIYAVMSRRLAPVQITWLGWDASGAPEVDYFIADPYVLPDDAQDYYAEKIWRLPHTYVAVDGFEVGTPTIRRETLNIPPTAVVYYSAQVGYKIHPDTVRLQFQILTQVPDSFLLIKARTDNTAVSDFYREIADEIGLDFARLRFLDKDSDEITHRANLQIADVMLDSFPYNGATTTLETLWLGIPLVTRVGQQFAARNSYTFMVNAGITEGIAWSAEEYLEWGIRLGTDADLRQQVAGKLLDVRSTAPLWNARQFTKDMENAYGGMWQNHQQKQLQSED